MKILCLILFAFAIFFIGCSSTYKVSDFKSNDNYFDKFNISVINKKTKVTLIGDSILTPCLYTKISHDTLIVLSELKNVHKTVFLNDMKNIEYDNTDSYSNRSGKIILKNGEEIMAGNIEILPDASISFNLRKYKYIPIRKVKEVSYKNLLLGGILGFVYGVPLGFIAGEVISILFASPTGRGGAGSQSQTNAFLTGIISCPIIGAIIGSLNGYTYTYQFNP